MSAFFSFVTEPEYHGGERFYFNASYRKINSINSDSHTMICKFYSLNEDKCNKYEYNPLTKAFIIDQINCEINDSLQAEDWVRKLNFKEILFKIEI